MIAGPRNMSTAMMYAFDQRPACSVVDEPFYAHYLKHNEVDHPDRELCLASMSTDVDAVMLQHFQPLEAGREVFIKNMAHHIDGLSMDQFSHCTHFFLIRHPARTIASYTKVVKELSLRDLALEAQLKQYNALKAMGQQPVIVDSSDLLRDPAHGMAKLCEALGIDYHPEMLQWNPGPRKADGVWARHWYGGVHRSTGIQKKHDPLPAVGERYEVLLKEAMTYYEELFTRRLL